jgi:hypothetical protein
MHDVHPVGEAILWDGCAECVRRGDSPYTAICLMDPDRFRHAWARATKLQRDGLRDGQEAELKTLRVLIAVQLQFEQCNIASFGTPLDFIGYHEPHEEEVIAGAVQDA